MKPTTKPIRTAEQRAEEEAIRRHHAANPIHQRPASAINRQSFTAILSLVARFKAAREGQGLTLAEVAERMGIDAPALSRLETGKMLNPTLATLHKWAEALGQKMDVNLCKDPSERPNAILSQKRQEWLEVLTGDDRHSIRKQIAIMIWDVATYRMVNEARRLAPVAPGGGVQLNGLFHNLLDRGFLSHQVLAVRRLVDGYPLTGKKGVYSLRGVLDDMAKNSTLFTRVSMLEAEGVPYDFEESKRQDRRASWQEGACMSSHTNNWRWSVHRHEIIDRLTNTDPKARKPDDIIAKERFNFLKKSMISSSERITVYADKFIAHASTPESRALVKASSVAIDELWKAHEILSRVASCLATEFLGASFCTGLATPLYDQFDYIDKPLTKRKEITKLRRVWEEFDQETQKWNYFEWDNSSRDLVEGFYDGFPS